MDDTKIDKPSEKPVAEKPHANYLLVFVVLAVLTGLEILITQLPLPRAPILIPLSFIKATLVALFYMHLRSDRRVFSAVFVIGILFGVSLILSFLVLISTYTGGLTP